MTKTSMRSGLPEEHELELRLRMIEVELAGIELKVKKHRPTFRTRVRRAGCRRYRMRTTGRTGRGRVFYPPCWTHVTTNW